MPASFTTTSFTPDGLIVGGEIISRQITIASGAGALARGTVLGKIAIGAAASAAKSGGNTGTGTLTLDATTPTLANAQVGVYAVRVITAGTNSLTARVTDPKGNVLGDVSVSTSLGSATFANQIKFAIADGATDFVVGDGFDVTVVAGNGYYVESLAAAVDGSQTPDCILAEDADATLASIATPAYFSGDFNDSAIVLGAGHTAASIREGLRQKGINLIPVQTTY